MLPEVAALSHVERVDALEEVATPEGVWTLSRIPFDADDLVATGGVMGDPDGDYGTDWVQGFEYGEILLIDGDGQIARAYPMPGTVPSWIVMTEAAIFAGRIGDGALPDSTLVRLDRVTLDADVLLIPAPFDGGTQWPADWAIATPAQVRVYEDSVGFASQGAEGTPAESWIGDVVIDIDGINALVGRVGDCPDRPAG